MKTQVSPNTLNDNPLSQMDHFHKAEIGKRLMASVVDEQARKHPHQKFCIIPNRESPREGFQDVSFEDIARVVDQMSWWIARTLGCGDDQTLAYLGTNDIRYLILFLSCNKTGYKVCYIFSCLSELLTNFLIAFSSFNKEFRRGVTTSVETNEYQSSAALRWI